MNGILDNICYEFYFHKLKGNKIVTLTRIRNEALILNDFLNHISTFSDGIIVFDDDSTDETLDICRSHDKVCCIIRNTQWSSTLRTNQETFHRDLLNQCASYFFDFLWFFYLDADERLIGNIREDTLSLNKNKIHYIRVPLYDAYLTPNDCQPFTAESSLLNGRVFFGPERRDIIFAWNKHANAEYILDDAREPSVSSNQYTTIFLCQHYGKAISKERWDDKCYYYINNFPFDVYGRKWESRLGKAVHCFSDFDTPLYKWGDELFSNAIRIHPLD